MKISAMGFNAKELKQRQFPDYTTEEMAKILDVPIRTLERWMGWTPEAARRWFWYYDCYWHYYKLCEEQKKYIDQLEMKLESYEK